MTTTALASPRSDVRELARLRHEDGTARTPWNQLEVNAFVAAVTNGVGRRRSSPSDGDATGTCDAEAAEVDDARHALRVLRSRCSSTTRRVDGLHDHTVCETEDGIAIPVSTVRRLCCDAEIIPVVLGTDGVPMGHGSVDSLRQPGATASTPDRITTWIRPDGLIAHHGCSVNRRAATTRM